MAPVPWQIVFEHARRDFFFVAPEGMLVFFGLAILLTDFFLTAKQKSWNALTALLGVAFSAGALSLMLSVAPHQMPAFDGSIVIDAFFVFFGYICLATTALVILFSARYMEMEEEQRGEYYALMLFAAAGMMFLACGNDLVVLFVALETVAVSSYVLAIFLDAGRRSREGAIKYVLTGAFSSAILAYGFSILYGLAGSTNLPEIAAKLAIRPRGDLLAYLALATICAGVLVKIAAAPFHQWAPDVCEAAPMPVTAYAAAGSKIAGFALLLRLFLTVFWPVRAELAPVIAVVATLSLAVGALAAITQSNIARLLAYSSIAQSGYILLGFVAAVNKDGSLNSRGLQAMSFCLFFCALYNTGAFAIVSLLHRKGAIGENVDDLNGLARQNPAMAALMLIFLLSLAGIPPTAGFIGNLLVISALIETQHMIFAVLAVLYILVAVYYYFRMVSAMWARKPADASQPTICWPQRWALGAVAIVALAAGIFPEQLLRLAQYSILSPLVR